MDGFRVNQDLRRSCGFCWVIIAGHSKEAGDAMNPKIPNDIDEYIERHSNEDQRLLRQMRATIHKAAPEASEKISYGIPTLYLNGNLVHFAVFTSHIGFYPTSSGIAAFKKQLGPYKWSKGAVQFPKNKPLPLSLVAKIVKFRVKQNLNK